MKNNSAKKTDLKSMIVMVVLPLVFIGLLVSIYIYREEQASTNGQPPGMMSSQADSLIDANQISEEKRGVASAKNETSVSSTEEFKKWIDNEAKLVESPAGINENGKTEELKKMASQLNEEQQNILKQISVSQTTPMSKRILASYVLSQTNNLKAIEESILSQQVPRDFAPHTIEEAQAAQARSIQLVKVDGLLEKVSQNPTISGPTITTLQNIADKTQDPFLKKYIEKKLKDSVQL